MGGGCCERYHWLPTSLEGMSTMLSGMFCRRSERASILCEWVRHSYKHDWLNTDDSEIRRAC